MRVGSENRGAEMTQKANLSSLGFPRFMARLAHLLTFYHQVPGTAGQSVHAS